MRLFAFLCLFIPCLGWAQTYVIQGDIPELSADTLVILKIRDGYEVDKIPVVDGRFEYQDSIAEPYFVQLLIVDPGTNETSGKLTEFMVEAGTIYVEGEDADYEQVRVRGSESDRVLKAYFAEDEVLSERWNSLKLEYDEYQAAGDTLARKQAARTLNSITFDERIPLLKQYVKRYRDQVIGALIPNFCTLQEVLKPEDYREMYEMLTPEMQQTAYGQSIQGRSQ